jgi:hypothetical protein
MESLLGLSDENLNGKHLNSEAVTRASPDVQDSLDRALMDFEETLELAFQKTLLFRHLEDLLIKTWLKVMNQISISLTVALRAIQLVVVVIPPSLIIPCIGL